MKPWLCLLLVFATALISDSAPAAASPTRLAIIADPALQAAADSLTVALSKQPDLILLERADIGRVLREQHLAAAGLTPAGSVHLGHLLKADGLLLLESVRLQDQPTASMRLVAVDAGVAVGAFFNPPPPPGSEEEWSHFQMTNLRALLPKLAVKRGDAMPLSLLPIHADSGSREAVALEQSLNLLLAARLIREPRCFVLERWRLQDAAAEQWLNASGAGAFWSGRRLIDGTARNAGGTLRAKLRLRPAAGAGQPKAITAEAKNLVALVEALAEKILAALPRAGSAARAAIWNPLDESKQYAEEARWALRWNFPEQAIAASEASVGLGDDSLEALSQRWTAYNRLGWPVSAPGEVADLMRLEPPFTSASEVTAANLLPRLTAMRRALTLYAEALAADADAARWQPEASRLLVGASRLLEGVYCFTSPLPDEVLAAAKSLRRQARDVYRQAANLSGGQGTLPPTDRLPQPPSATDKSLYEFNRATAAVGIGLASEALRDMQWWQESPPDGAPEIKAILQRSAREGYPQFQSALQLLTHRLTPGVNRSHGSLEDRMLRGDWSHRGDPAACRRSWSNLSDELLRDPALCCQYAGCLLKLRMLGEESFLELTSRNRPPPFWRGPEAKGDLCAEASQRVRQFFSDHEPQAMSGQIPLLYLTQLFAAIDKIQDARFEAAPMHAFIQKIVLHQLGSDAPFQMESLLPLLSRSGLPLADAKALRQALDASVIRRRAAGTLPPQELKNASQLMLALVKKSAEPMPGWADLRQPAPPPLAVRLPVGPGWKASRLDPAGPPPPRARSHIHGVLWQDHRFWVKTVWQQDPNQSNAPQIWHYSPLKAEQVQTGAAPSLDLSLQPKGWMGYEERWPDFAVLKDAVYAWNQEAIICLRPDAASEKTLTLPKLNVSANSAREPVFWTVGDHLCIATPEGSILRADPAKAAFETLASSRRRPAQTHLDDQPWVWRVERLAADRQGKLQVRCWPLQSPYRSAGERIIYTYEAASRDWEQTARFPIPQAGAAYDRTQALEQLAGAWAANDLTWIDRWLGERMLLDLDQNGQAPPDDPSIDIGALYLHAPPTDEGNGRYRSFVDLLGAASDGENLWAMALHTFAGDQQIVLIFVPPRPAAFQCVALELPKEEFHALARFEGKIPKLTRVRMIPTPEGLAFYVVDGPALWFLPKEHLRAAGAWPAHGAP